MRRHTLVISHDEQLGRRLRYLLAGLRIGFPTTVVRDLGAALPVLKRLRPRVVVYVGGQGQKSDDQLMLLRILLLLGEQGEGNRLALLYDSGTGLLTMYHNAMIAGVCLEDVAQAAVKTMFCPLFGYETERTSGFPEDCHFLPLVAAGAAMAAAPTVKTKNEAL